MDNSSLKSNNREKASNLVIDGLFNGLVAGISMLAYLLIVALGTSGSIEELLSSFAMGNMVSPWRGTLTHLAVSMIYGTIFGLLWSGFQIFTPKKWLWLTGPVFGLILLFLAEFAILPGADSPLDNTMNVLHLTLAHLIYGLLLGILFAQKQTTHR